jgi:hypothetical protein
MPKSTQHPPDERFTWDWVTVVLVLLGIAILLILTFELWAGHGEP